MGLIKSITPNQWFAIIIAILSAVGGATAQLSDLFGAAAAHNIVTVSTLSTTIISSILVSLTSQGAQIKAVSSMPGVDRIVVNKEANQTLAQAAIDPTSKAEPASGDAAKVLTETAKG